MTSGVFLPAWYVAFVPGNGWWWQRLFLREGFGHCYAFGWDEPAGRWLVFMWGWDGIMVRAMPEEWFPAFLAKAKADGARIVLARSENAMAFRPRLFATCVTSVEALLGLPSRRALTPYGLYRTLLARGALEI